MVGFRALCLTTVVAIVGYLLGAGVLLWFQSDAFPRWSSGWEPTAEVLQAVTALAAVGAIIAALFVASRQSRETRRSEAKRVEISLLLDLIRVTDVSIDAMTAFVHNLDWVRASGQPVGKAEIRSSGKVSDAHEEFSAAARNVILVVTASRRERFPAAARDIPMFDFAILVNGLHDRFRDLHDHAVFELPTLEQFIVSEPYKALLDKLGLLRLAVANLIAFTFTTREWEADLMKRVEPPPGRSRAELNVGG
jgi:hypothetical protein